jgi:DNA-binding MarR family transcriptional regulator
MPPGPQPQHPPFGAGQAPPSVAYLLSTLGYEVSRDLGARLADVGLELRQFGLLRLVAQDDGQSQRALGAVLEITPNRMVGLVDDLERRGLIERRAHPVDRRAYALALTDAGRALLATAFQAAFGVERDVCSGLSPDERGQLLGLLRKVAQRKSGMNSAGGAAAGVHPGMLDRDAGTVQD